MAEFIIEAVNAFDHEDIVIPEFQRIAQIFLLAQLEIEGRKLDGLAGQKFGKLAVQGFWFDRPMLPEEFERKYCAR